MNWLTRNNPAPGGAFIVYYHRDENGDLLYVGQTTQFKKRQKQHRYSAPWWKDIDIIDWVMVSSERQMMQLEMAEIITQRPRFNSIEKSERLHKEKRNYKFVV
jgi:excinuclease UvrABC nuclease subunit